MQSRKVINRSRDLIGVIRLFKNWPIRILEFFNLYPGKRIKYHLRNGLVFNVRTKEGDTGFMLDSFRNHVYDRHSKIATGDVIIDIGANIGDFTVYAASIARAGAIYAFEPIEENFKILQKNVKENNLLNAKIFNLGVADKKKKSRLALSEYKGGASIYTPEKPTGKHISIEFVGLKDIFAYNKIDSCDFLKMDCEGAEYDILFNCPKKILKTIKYIAMEFHDFGGPYNHLQLKDYLEKNGFRTIISDENQKRKLGMIYAIRKT